jgi:glycosyltransferase involved in cell wall biosynthesis
VRILHVSHTDLRIDHRVLRAFSVGVGLGFDVYGIGVASEGSSTDKVRAIHTNKIIALSRGRVGGLLGPPHVESEARPRIQGSHRSGSLVSQAFLWLWLTLNIASAVRRVRPEMIHVHDVVALPGAVIGRLIWKSQLVYDAHELHADKSGGTSFQSYLLLLVETVCWRYLSGFVTVSEGIRDWYFARQGKPRAVVVHNSINLSDSRSEASGRSRDKLEAIFSQDSPVSPRFIYVGALEKGRGLETALALFSDPLLHATFVMLGSGTLESELRKKAKCQQNIHFLDPVPNSQIPTVIENFDYGWCVLENVSLSDYLSLPNKLFEYLISGLVPICSNFPEMSRIIAEVGSGITVDPADFQELRREILQLVSLGRPKKKSIPAVEGYLWGAQARKLQELYEEILAVQR